MTSHLAVIGVEMQNVHPVVAPVVTEIAFALRNLVCVMRESIVDSAAVNVKVFAEVLHGDAGALDVPSGITRAPGGFPLESLIFKLGLREPEDEIVSVALVGVLVNAFANADGEVFLVEIVEDIVLFKL